MTGERSTPQRSNRLESNNWALEPQGAHDDGTGAGQKLQFPLNLFRRHWYVPRSLSSLNEILAPCFGQRVGRGLL